MKKHETKLPPPIEASPKLDLPAPPRVPSTTPPPSEDVPTLIRDLKAFTRARFDDVRAQLGGIERDLRRHDERLTKTEAGLREVRRKFKRLERAILTTSEQGAPPSKTALAPPPTIGRSSRGPLRG